MNTKYIFVIGGVLSGVGKGVTTASLGRIFKNRGYHVSAIKIDPYINVDAGTMNPVEHGEVFVTEDMVGHRLGEFSPTRKFRRHGGKMAREQEKTTTPATGEPAKSKA